MVAYAAQSQRSKPTQGGTASRLTLCAMLTATPIGNANMKQFLLMGELENYRFGLTAANAFNIIIFTIRIIGLELLVLIFGFAKAEAQDSLLLEKRHHFISAWFGVNQIKDENLHPKVSTGTITELSYGFERRKNNFTQFQFILGYSRLKTKFEELSASANFKLNLNYSYNLNLYQNNKLKYYLGPKAVLAYSACYFPLWDESHLYWADYFSIGVNNILSVRLKNKNEWLASLSIPIFSLYSRPDYLRLYKIDAVDFGGIAKNLNSDITPGFWGNAFELNFETAYCFPVFKNNMQAFTYSLEFLRIKKNDGKPFTQLSHQIGIKFWL